MMRMSDSPRGEKPMPPEEAEAVAIQALAFVAGEPDLLSRFVALSGIEPHEMRRAAREPGFLAGVLNFVVRHEPTLIAFAEAAGLDPADPVRAMKALPHGDDRYEASS